MSRTVAGIRSLVAGAAALLFASGAVAVPITEAQWNAQVGTLESDVESIFQNAGSGIDIDFSFNGLITVVAPAYTDINSDTEQNDLLFGHGLGEAVGGNVVTAYIVESMSFCGGGPTPGLIGCAVVGGNRLSLEGDFLLNDSDGDLLFAHEIAHNFGLVHVATANNLMLPTLVASNTVLTDPQLATIAADNLVVNGTVTIQPVLVLSSATSSPAPEPGTALLAGLFAFGLACNHRRRRRA